MDFFSEYRPAGSWLSQRQVRAQLRGRTARASYRVIHGYGLWPRVTRQLGSKEADDLLVTCDNEWVDLEEHLRVVEHALMTSERKSVVEIGGAIGAQCLGEACRYGALQKASSLVGPMGQLLIVQAPLLWTGSLQGAGKVVLERVGMRQATLAIEEAPRILLLSSIWQALIEGATSWAMRIVGAKAKVQIFAEPRANTMTIDVRWQKLPNSRPSIVAM